MARHDQPGSAAAVDRWLRERGHRTRGLTPLPGDVSARRYLRAELVGGGRLIAAFYPPEIRSQCRLFTRTTHLLSRAGVAVPAILDHDCRSGIMALEDLGDRTLADLAGPGWSALLPWYGRALALLDRIGALPVERVADLNPPLDGPLLRRELDQTWELYLLPHGLTGPPALARELRRGLDHLCSRLGAAPRVTCHRDFMARNLIPRESGPSLVLLDHQGLRPGPPGYDLASLLNDTLFPPAEVVDRLLADRLPTAAARRLYGRAAAQRCLKAAGTFEAFRRRGNPRHQRLIRPTLERALRHLADLPETAPSIAELEPLWRRHLDAPVGRRGDLLD